MQTSLHAPCPERMAQKPRLSGEAWEDGVCCGLSGSRYSILRLKLSPDGEVTAHCDNLAPRFADRSLRGELCIFNVISP
jgi:hypothetical protein